MLVGRDLMSVGEVRTACNLPHSVYAACDRDGVGYVLPFNVAPKPSADPPWRLIQNAMFINDKYEKWQVRFESYKTIPLVVEEGWYCFTLGLRAGYHHVRLTEELSRMCGGKVWLQPGQFEELKTEGLLLEGIRWNHLVVRAWWQ